MSRADRSRSTGDPRPRLLRDAPLRRRAIRAAGLRTAVLTGGDGPPLLLLHGGIECGGASWAPVASRLARSHRLAVPDMPGLGESEPPARGEPAAFDRWLADVIAGTCEDAPTLVAHSLGASLAARFAVRHGALLHALVIYAAPGVGRYHMPLGLRITATRWALRPSVRNMRRFERWAFFDPQRTRGRDPGWHDAFVAYTCSRARAPHVRRAMRSLIAEGTRRIEDDDLRRIAAPTALLWGRHDRMVPLAVANAAASSLGVALHVVDDAGHVPHVESPAAFGAALRRAIPPQRAASVAVSGP